MPTIIAYQKFINVDVTRILRLPEDPATHQTLGTELATLSDGLTYVSLPDGAVLPVDQPEEIAGSIATVTLTDMLKESIKAASPHTRLISQRMQEKIRATYTLEDEQFFSRIGVGVALGAYTFGAGEQAALLEFGAFVEGVRQWGRSERAKFGL